MPLFLKYFVDDIIANKDVTNLQLFSVVLIVFLIFKFRVENLMDISLLHLKKKHL